MSAITIPVPENILDDPNPPRRSFKEFSAIMGERAKRASKTGSKRITDAATTTAAAAKRLGAWLRKTFANFITHYYMVQAASFVAAFFAGYSLTLAMLIILAWSAVAIVSDILFLMAFMVIIGTWIALLIGAVELINNLTNEFVLRSQSWRRANGLTTRGVHFRNIR